jgi:hypothetical protein
MGGAAPNRLHVGVPDPSPKVIRAIARLKQSAAADTLHRYRATHEPCRTAGARAFQEVTSIGGSNSRCGPHSTSGTSWARERGSLSRTANAFRRAHRARSAAHEEHDVRQLIRKTSLRSSVSHVRGWNDASWLPGASRATGCGSRSRSSARSATAPRLSATRSRRSRSTDLRSIPRRADLRERPPRVHAAPWHAV